MENTKTMHHETAPWLLDHKLICGESVLMDFLSAVPGALAVLDGDRRIVWASADLVQALNLSAPLSILGLRPGEALGCVHAHESPLGCGGAEACYGCGAVEAILESRKQGRRVTRRARLEVGGAGGPRFIDREISAGPWSLGSRCFTVLTLN